MASASDFVVKECLTLMLFSNIDVSHLMFHARQIEEEKHKGKARYSKR